MDDIGMRVASGEGDPLTRQTPGANSTDLRACKIKKYAGRDRDRAETPSEGSLDEKVGEKYEAW